jgi:ABC-type nitrate/sulfonate/bicarbonate transport system substrate-binding protein
MLRHPGLNGLGAALPPRLWLFLIAGQILFGNLTVGNAQTIPLRYAQAHSALRSIFSLPVAVAERAGIFRREGLDFQVVVPIPGGSDKMIDALNDGSADVTHIATPFLVRAVMRGSDTAAIVSEFNNPIYSLVSKPSIKTIADLKGKLIGLADEAGTITLSIRRLLALRGLRSEEFRVKTIEGTPARYNCLRRGECDAVPLGQPQDLLALKEGYRLLGLSTEAVPEFLYTVTAARRPWASANKEAVVRYVRALNAVFKFIRDPANQKIVIDTIVGSTDSPPEIAAQTLKLFFEPERNVLPRRAEINVKGLSQALAFMGEAGNLKQPLPPPERFIDTQYLAAAGIK